MRGGDFFSALQRGRSTYYEMLSIVGEASSLCPSRERFPLNWGAAGCSTYYEMVITTFNFSISNDLLHFLQWQALAYDLALWVDEQRVGDGADVIYLSSLTVPSLQV